MTAQGQQPKFLMVRNIPGAPLQVATDDAQDIQFFINKKQSATLSASGKLSLINDNGAQFSIKPSTTATASNYVTPPSLPTIPNQFLSAGPSGIMSWQSVGSQTAASIASNDSNVTFLATDNLRQLGCFPNAPRTYTLPSTGIAAGTVWQFYNSNTLNTITLNASNNTKLDFIVPLQNIVIVAKVDNPTTPSDWLVISAESNWTFYEPVITGCGTIAPANIRMNYRRQGNALEITGAFTSSAVTSDPMTISIPTSFGIPAISESIIGYASVLSLTPPPFTFLNMFYSNGIPGLAFSSPTEPGIGKTGIELISSNSRVVIPVVTIYNIFGS